VSFLGDVSQISNIELENGTFDKFRSGNRELRNSEPFDVLGLLRAGCEQRTVTGNLWGRRFKFSALVHMCTGALFLYSALTPESPPGTPNDL
jgi:hypothetical protein